MCLLAVPGRLGDPGRQVNGSSQVLRVLRSKYPIVRCPVPALAPVPATGPGFLYHEIPWSKPPSCGTSTHALMDLTTRPPRPFWGMITVRHGRALPLARPAWHGKYRRNNTVWSIKDPAARSSACVQGFVLLAAVRDDSSSILLLHHLLPGPSAWLGFIHLLPLVTFSFSCFAQASPFSCRVPSSTIVSCKTVGNTSFIGHHPLAPRILLYSFAASPVTSPT
ncbi:hypothetical protein EDB80DRAFT_54501 [Ilyonectria destructans]|nr:hypothetical protein EDB80DRAFT_54501 [Ilyonectria destructans]